jgi:ADP-heptose:LPS heptosyltransferase
MWFINKTEKPFQFLVKEQKKWVIAEPGIPFDLPVEIGKHYINKYSCIKTCNDPQRFFSNKKMSQLIIRDAGIGDLLLLEPVLRGLNKDQNRNLTLLTMLPDVLKGNPHITAILKQKRKEDLEASSVASFHVTDDLRNYSEVHPKRHKEHRTDIYNQRFGLKLQDKEPRVYFSDEDKPLLQKKNKHTYIGVCLDSSHGYRDIANGDDIITGLLKDKKNIVVVFGAKQIYKNSNKRIIDLQGKTTIRQAMNYIRCLDKMFSVDTGLMHIALALHIPTACFFSIITPDLRLRYFTGPYKVIQKDIHCKGCGDFHMSMCSKGLPKGEADCQKIPLEQIINTMNELPNAGKPRSFKEEKTNIVNSVNIVKSNKKLTMPIIVQDEEKNLPRFIENVINHPMIGRVIAIDGGSKDKTVELLEKAGAEVYHHPYIKEYHDMQAMQRNISCSYVSDGEKVLIMDIDECFSAELSDYLGYLVNSSIEYGLVSRRTFDYYKDITNPAKQIKDYPDWQPRFYTWNKRFKFVGGAHHQTLNVPQPINIQKDIIHFEKEGKDRNALEKQWANMMNGVKKYA